MSGLLNDLIELMDLLSDTGSSTPPPVPPLTTTCLTVDAIVMDLITFMDDTDRHFVRKMKKKDLTNLHHGFGTEIRNRYQLWHDNHPLTMLHYKPMIVDDADVSPHHPDAVSMEIIELLHRKLQYIS